jgi:hypothetical protein
MENIILKGLVKRSQGFMGSWVHGLTGFKIYLFLSKIVKEN